MQASKVIIGVAGRNGAGKDTFTKLCVEIIKEKNGLEAKVHSSGEIIMACLRICNLWESRPNAQKFVEVMEQGFSKGFLSKAMRKLLIEDPSPCVFFNGVRLESDAVMLRNLDTPGINSSIVYVRRDQKLRFDGMRNRKTKVGENDLTWEKFLEQEAAMTEQYMGELEKQAHVAIGNNSSLDELKELARAFCEIHVLPLLKPRK